MLLSRRTMLQASVGAIALSLTGCNNTKTILTFVNNAAAPLSVDATANGKNFKKKNIQPGHSASQTYRTNDKVGTLVPVTGTVTVQGQPANNLNGLGLEVALGMTNTFTVDGFGFVTVVVK